ncbi:MAG TPA: ADP-ribosylglycohydrolase family protein [Steroidobacteraceae bacterium]|nr:ADP-ribosylglycohydrolase family protein [Steroidobacteraceae bacterium]
MTTQGLRLRRARASLEGLSLGDAFGEQFFRPVDAARALIAARTLPEPPWPYTDDTAMAISVVEVLAECGGIDQDRLASRFADRHSVDPARGYGRGAHEILQSIAAGMHWRVAARNLFEGRGSMGNGAAMRAAPIGAWFADDLAQAVEHARRSAEITHAHPEAQAGAIAVAVAAACVAAKTVREPRALFESVLALTPASATRDVIDVASRLTGDTPVDRVVATLGNGAGALSQDTVPFCLWCAAWHLGRYEEALWRTVAGLGDRDTTCAIVGGIVAADPAIDLPPEWCAARELLDVVPRRKR